ncbi:alpha-xylosidase [Halalkalibacter sp. APA_J-10(15)]|uniref:alpha-xylosidase n=1 Tax=unclassified Halalkalibacter TaxID=2893063 RepID=UPI001FF10AC6|nr:alpha-xylosidase [Halalkalibacter sp. APA_J-10(15)]MCK0470180.1 alpha-xylosidase [Halalkalibacter sp. APA_J-10(15)]
MKFSNGQWLTKEGYQLISPVELFDVDQHKDSVTLVGPPKPIVNRSGQLDTPLIEVNLSSPMKDVIRVQVDHHKGARDLGPHFEIKEDENVTVSIKNNDEGVVFSSGDVSAQISKEGGWELGFYYKDELLTASEFKSVAHVIADDGQTYMRDQLSIDPGEYVYGLGERFTPFVKNGQVVDIWNKDGGTSSEQSYKNIPFYLTNKNYGVFVNHPENVSLEVASEHVSKVQFSVPGQKLDYFIIGGSSMKEVLENYTSLTGKPALPPAWTFGLWLTTSFTTDYDEDTVNSFIDGMAERDLPLHVFHFDCFWMKEFQWCNFEWDDRIFPEPQQMLERLKAKGLKICVWINPYIAQRSSLFMEAKENGYFIKKENGDVWQWDLWQPGMGIVDFTNPAACQWYADKLRDLVDMGVDSFKTDFGERIPTDVVYHDGSDPVKMHNYYTFLYNKVVFDVLEEKLGKGEAALFARSATAGGQQFPVHWGGDCTATYASMAESLRGGLSLGMSGFGYWSHDIGGFESTATADVYKRWAAFGLLSSHSRLHGSRSYRVPWLYDEEAVDVVRHFTKLKCQLMPYLFSEANESSQKGIPMMRPMVLEYSNDPNCDQLDRQYMLGQSLLVAPIFNEKGIAKYYLPEGTWSDFVTGRTIEGGAWKQEHHDYLSVPLFVRPNSVIAVGHNDTKPDYDFADHVDFQLFALEAGNKAETTVYAEQGEEEVSFTATREGETITISVTGASKPYTVTLRGVNRVAGVTGATAEDRELGISLTPAKGESTIVVTL